VNENAVNGSMLAEGEIMRAKTAARSHRALLSAGLSASYSSPTHQRLKRQEFRMN